MLQVGKRLKLYKEENYAIKSNEYLDISVIKNHILAGQLL